MEFVFDQSRIFINELLILKYSTETLSFSLLLVIQDLYTG
jgi:hypothetical protein